MKPLPKVIDDTAARRALLELVNYQIACPDCAAVPTPQQLSTVLAGGRARCNNCNRFYSWSTGTVFFGTTLSAAQVLILANCQLAGVSHNYAARLAECSRSTAREWYARLAAVQP